jgi:hypothetical protein
MATLWALAGCSASDETLIADAAIVTDAAAALDVSVAPSPVTPRTRRLRVVDESAEPTPISAPRKGTCGGLSEAPRTQTWLLHQRVGLTLPADFHSTAYSNNASRASREQGWVEHGDARVRVVVAERFSRAERSLVAAVRADVPEGWSMRSLGEDALVTYPHTLIARDVDTPLATVYLRDEDDLVLSIAFITDPENAAQGGCLALARRLARSAVVGPDRVVLSARSEYFEGFDIDVPEGFASTVDEGPDFAIFRLTRIRRQDRERSPRESWRARTSARALDRSRTSNSAAASHPQVTGEKHPPRASKTPKRDFKISRRDSESPNEI